jgi:hypothetical protein
MTESCRTRGHVRRRRSLVPCGKINSVRRCQTVPLGQVESVALGDVDACWESVSASTDAAGCSLTRTHASLWRTYQSSSCSPRSTMLALSVTHALRQRRSRNPSRPSVVRLVATPTYYTEQMGWCARIVRLLGSRLSAAGPMHDPWNVAGRARFPYKSSRRSPSDRRVTLQPSHRRTSDLP